jgi:hypothetical protein
MRSINHHSMAAASAPSLGRGEAPATIPAAAANATSGPPIIAINGGNPATISVGATYADLGATITGPKDDLNLGVHTFVDGIATDPAVIDTTAAGSHIIEYVVSDSAGLTSTSTRTVIVSAPANDNQATSNPQVANDNSPLPSVEAI